MSPEPPDAADGPDTGPDHSPKKSRKRSPVKGNRPPRKRTKTGCLTCRKRRIKCGEERPTCLNCQKSRRECEGYRPPIVFRRSHNLNLSQTPISPAPDSALSFGGNVFPYPGFLPQYGSSAQDDSTLVSMAPAWSATNSVSSDSGQGLHSGLFDHMRSTSNPNITSQATFSSFSSPESVQPPMAFPTGHPWQLHAGRFELNYTPQEQNPHSSIHGLGINTTQGDVLNFLPQGTTGVPLTNPSLYRDPGQSSYGSAAQSSSASVPLFALSGEQQEDIVSFPSLYSGGNRRQSEASNLGTPAVSLSLNDSSNQVQSLFTSIPRVQQPLNPESFHSVPTLQPALGFPDPSQILDAAAVINQDDDYWDLPSDEEGEPVEDKTLLETESLEKDFETITTLTKHTLSLAINNLNDADAYSYPGFSLDEYRPENTANPLRNPYTQRVFAHFVFSTGPLISYLQQRQRIAPTRNFGIRKIRCSHQGLWTYTLATMALHNQGLLHAMLAMSSFHIAKLQGASTTPSLKHYSYALRRIHRDVQHNRKRHEVSTLAATLLLAFFEIGQADHRKWSTHLVGAKQLISEIDFASMMTRIKYVKVIRAFESGKFPARYDLSDRQSDIGFGEGQPCDATIEELFPELDEQLLNMIKGERYKSTDRDVMEEYGLFGFSETLTGAELRNYQILQDLFWWNCRHDIIHGLVGGNALLLDYDKWSHCPPRAPVGQPDAVHGTFDHLILLMGRLVKFISDDRPRKISASKASSGSGNFPNPGFYGMAPSTGPGPIPRAYQPFGFNGSSSEETFPATTVTQETNASQQPEAQTASAIAINEWDEIYAAFMTLGNSLGPAFQPIDDEHQEPLTTPFGSAIIFRSYAIAALWAWYYAGLIIAIRSHPSMPAAQTIASRVAASKTERYAIMVGRITYCITSDFMTPPLDPSSAGAFAESSLPVFFAGVQYKDPEQRRWTIGHLREIENLTGWATIGLCANGCELSWIKAFEMGVGPEYNKSMGIHQGRETVIMTEEDQEKVLENSIRTGTKTELHNESIPKNSRNPKSPSNKHGDNSNSTEHERRFSPFYRGSQVMWAYQLFSTTLKDDLECATGSPHRPVV